jgi:AcrR family transcriptional regulator
MEGTNLTHRAPFTVQLDSLLSSQHIYAMGAESKRSTSLRERQTEATRNLLLDVAFSILTTESREVISHELVAERAGASPRTVYRHFPTQADLYRAVWEDRLRERIPPGFPSVAADIAPLAKQAFARFDENEPIIRALMASPAGMRIRDRGGVEGRAAFDAALAPLTAMLDPDQRRIVVAVFVALFSSPYWQVLRDRAQLTGPDAQRAVAWAMTALLNTLTHHPEVAP